MPYSFPFPFFPVISGEDAESVCVVLGLREFLIPQSQTSHLSWRFHPLLLTAALWSPRRYLQLAAKDKMTEGFLMKTEVSGLAPVFLLRGAALGTVSLLQMFQVLLLLTLAALGLQPFRNTSFKQLCLISIFLP